VIVEPEMGMTVMAGEALGCMLVSHYVVTILINIPSLRYNLVKHTKSSGLRHIFSWLTDFCEQTPVVGSQLALGFHRYNSMDLMGYQDVTATFSNRRYCR
jgi:hypothetical protein